MRRLLIGLVVSATTVLLPVLALADNQEVAEQIAGNLRKSGQLQGYKIGVKFQDGTAWLQGRVTSQKQLAKALKIAWNTEGVDRVVNRLEIAPNESSKAPTARLTTPGGMLTPEQLVRLTSASQERDSGTLTKTARRLQEIVDTKILPSRKETPKRQAEPVASSYVPQPVRQVSNTMMAQPVAMPQQMRQPVRQPMMARSNRPIPVAYINGQPAMMPQGGAPIPAHAGPMASGAAPVRYDQPCMPNCAWPSYAAYPNYAAVTYPKQYSPTAWPFIGPFYPYPQVPLGWRKVTLEWDDGWWMLDFKDSCTH